MCEQFAQSRFMKARDLLTASPTRNHYSYIPPTTQHSNSRYFLLFIVWHFVLFQANRPIEPDSTIVTFRLSNSLHLYYKYYITEYIR